MNDVDDTDDDDAADNGVDDSGVDSGVGGGDVDNRSDDEEWNDEISSEFDWDRARDGKLDNGELGGAVVVDGDGDGDDAPPSTTPPLLLLLPLLREDVRGSMPSLDGSTNSGDRVKSDVEP